MRWILAAVLVVGFAGGALATVQRATAFVVVGPNDGVRCVITNLDKKAQFVDAEGPTGKNGYCSFTTDSTEVRAVLEIEDVQTQALHVVIPATKR